MKVLCGDIGGTSTRLALVEWGESPRLLEQETYKSEDFDALEGALDAFGVDADSEIDAAGFGVAGPVSQGRVETTNLPWSVDASALAARFGLPSVSLVNDLAALAYGADLVRSQWKTLQKTSDEPQSSSRIFVGAGTGLGVAYEASGEVHASEGGHIGFAPRDEDECELWRRATERFGRASAERLISGGGLPLIFEHYAELCATPGALRAEVAARGGSAISEAASDGDEAAEKTLRKFVSLFGSASGDLALVFRPSTLLIAGGLALKLSDSLTNFDALFLSAFHDKGRMRQLNERVGVHIVADENAALFGAASSAIRFAISGSK
ncbi:MAG: glucokinase [Polyangiales bacterium]|jgi:glucokinase